MSDSELYRIDLEYEVAETFADQLDVAYGEGTDVNSLAADRFLIAEPCFGVVATVEIPSEDEAALLESRLSGVDLADTSAEIGVARGQIDQLGPETRVVVIIRPEFDVEALQQEVIEHVRACDGEVVVDTIPGVDRHEIDEAYFMLYDLYAPAATLPDSAAVQTGGGVARRVRNRLYEWLRPEGALRTTAGIEFTDAHVRTTASELRATAVDEPPSVAIMP